jgi:hypothetical protein
MSVFEMNECDFSVSGEHDWMHCGGALRCGAIFECRHCGCKVEVFQSAYDVSKTMIRKPREFKIELEDLNE